MVMGKEVEESIGTLKVTDRYEELWKVFFKTINIEQRKNLKGQQTHLPQWYRKNMNEFR
jgi:probable DNA metabolism protein